MPPEVKVVLGDSMGEMFAYYAACDIAFIGGSLLPFGGQNLLEACAVGRPVLTGPHTYNFSDATQQAVDVNAALRAGDAAELGEKLRELLGDSTRLAAMGHAGMQFIERNRGATVQAVRCLDSVLDNKKG